MHEQDDHSIFVAAKEVVVEANQEYHVSFRIKNLYGQPVPIFAGLFEEKYDTISMDIVDGEPIAYVEAHTADSILHFTCTPTTDSLTLLFFIEHEQNALYEIDDLQVYQLDSIQIDTILQFIFVDSSAVDVWRNSFSSSELDTMILSNTSYDTTGARMKVEMIVSYDDDDNENMSGAVYRRLYHLEEGNEYNIRFVLQTDGVSEIDSVEMILLRSSLFDAGFPNPDTILVVGHGQDTLEMNFVAKESEMIFAISARKASTTPYHYYVDEYSMRQKWVTKITCPPGNFHYAHENYRFGFNGAENIDEIKGFGNTPDLGDRWHDPRIARMNWKVDRRTAEYPWQSPYAYYANSPISEIDFNGEGEKWDAEGNLISKDEIEDGKTYLPKTGEDEFGSIGLQTTEVIGQYTGPKSSSLGVTMKTILRSGLDFAPGIGSGLDIYEGARDGNYFQLGMGVLFLTLDVATLGGSSLAKGGIKSAFKFGSKQFANNLAEVGLREGSEFAARASTKLPTQIHHFATNKHSVWTSKMGDIAKQYGLDLNGAWNKAAMPHLGRHPEAYHKFVFQNMQRAATEAGGNQAKFLQLFDQYVKQPVLQNPNLLRKSGW